MSSDPFFSGLIFIAIVLAPFLLVVAVLGVLETLEYLRWRKQLCAIKRRDLRPAATFKRSLQ